MYLEKPDICMSLVGKSFGRNDTLQRKECHFWFLVSVIAFYFYFACRMDGWMGGVATVGPFTSSSFSLGDNLLEVLTTFF